MLNRIRGRMGGSKTPAANDPIKGSKFSADDKFIYLELTKKINLEQKKLNEGRAKNSKVSEAIIKKCAEKIGEIEAKHAMKHAEKFQEWQYVQFMLGKPVLEDQDWKRKVGNDLKTLDTLKLTPGFQERVHKIIDQYYDFRKFLAQLVFAGPTNDKQAYAYWKYIINTDMRGALVRADGQFNVENFDNFVEYILLNFGLSADELAEAFGYAPLAGTNAVPEWNLRETLNWGAGDKRVTVFDRLASRVVDDRYDNSAAREATQETYKDFYKTHVQGIMARQMQEANVNDPTYRDDTIDFYQHVWDRREFEMYVPRDKYAQIHNSLAILIHHVTEIKNLLENRIPRRGGGNGGGNPGNGGGNNPGNGGNPPPNQRQNKKPNRPFSGRGRYGGLTDSESDDDDNEDDGAGVGFGAGAITTSNAGVQHRLNAAINRAQGYMFSHNNPDGSTSITEIPSDEDEEDTGVIDPNATEEEKLAFYLNQRRLERNRARTVATRQQEDEEIQDLLQPLSPVATSVYEDLIDNDDNILNDPYLAIGRENDDDDGTESFVSASAIPLHLRNKKYKKPEIEDTPITTSAPRPAQSKNLLLTPAALRQSSPAPTRNNYGQMVHPRPTNVPDFPDNADDGLGIGTNDGGRLTTSNGGLFNNQAIQHTVTNAPNPVAPIELPVTQIANEQTYIQKISQLEKAKTDLELAHRDCDHRLSQTIQAAQGQVDWFVQKGAQVERELNSLRIKYNNLVDDYNKAKGMIGADTSDLQEDMNAMKDMVDFYLRQVETLERARDEAIKLKDDTKKKAEEEIESLKKAHALLVQNVKLKEKEIEKLIDAKSKVETQKAESDLHHRQAIVDLNDKLADTERKLEETKKALQSNGQNKLLADQYNQLRKEHTQLLDKIQDLTAQNMETRKNYEKLKEDATKKERTLVAENAARRIAMNDRKAKLDVQKKVIESKDTQLQQKDFVIGNLEQRTRAQQAEIDRRDSDISDLKMDITRGNDKIQSLTNEIAKVRKELDDLIFKNMSPGGTTSSGQTSVTIADLEENLRVLQTKLLKTEEQQRKDQLELNNLMRKNVEIESEKHQLSKTLERKNKEIKDAEQRHTTTREHLAKKLFEEQTTHNLTKQSLQTLNEEIAQLRQQHWDDVKRLETEMKNVKDKKSDEYFKLIQVRDELQKNYDESLKNLEKAKDTATDLRTMIDQKDQEIAHQIKIQQHLRHELHTQANEHRNQMLRLSKEAQIHRDEILKMRRPGSNLTAEEKTEMDRLLGIIKGYEDQMKIYEEQYIAATQRSLAYDAELKRIIELQTQLKLEYDTALEQQRDESLARQKDLEFEIMKLGGSSESAKRQKRARNFARIRDDEAMVAKFKQKNEELTGKLLNLRQAIQKYNQRMTTTRKKSFARNKPVEVNLVDSDETDSDLI